MVHRKCFLKQFARCGALTEQIDVLTNKQFMARPQDCLDLTVSRLGVDQLDLWLMHWPVATRDTGEDPMVPRLPDGNRDVDLNQTPEKTWKGMCDAFKASGKTKAIGVSNFSIPKLERLLASTDIVPAVNQGETSSSLSSKWTM